MSIFISSMQPKPVTTASYISETLTIKNNHFVVKEGLRYHYFKISTVPPTEETKDRPIIRFDKYPPILRDGMVILDKKLYRVTSQDVLLGVIRKSREIKLEGVTDGSRKRTSIGKPTSVDITAAVDGGEVVQHSDESGLSIVDENEALEQANLYWEEQNNSLLDTLHQKEGGDWEISDITQSGSGNEVSSI